MKRLFLTTLFVAFSTSVMAQTNKEAVNEVLDNIHKYASEANFEGYFDLYTDDAIFLGTDATERWTISEFKEYAEPAFERGGWTYVMSERHVFISSDGNTAWFDERLDNEGFGECRGTGALVKIDGEWKVSQYNLTVPVPNALLRRVVGMIRAGENGQ